MKAFANHFTFELKTGVRNKNLLLMNYLFPLGFFLLMGFLMPELNPFFLQQMIPGMAIFAVLAACFLGLPEPLVKAKESGVLRSYRINGVPALSILAIPAITTILHLTVVIAIITVLSTLLFNAPLPESWLGFVLVCCSVSVACAGLSVLIGVVSSNSRMTVLWSQVFFIPSMLLGGLTIPIDILPAFAGKIGQLLPATHGMNAFQAFAYGGTPKFSAWGSIAVLLGGGLLAFLLAVYLFEWDRQNKTRRGHPALGFAVMLPYLAAIIFF